MKFNKIKDLSDKKSSQLTNLNKTKKIIKKKKIYKAKKKDELKIKTKVVMPKIKEDVSANWLQMQDLIKNQNEIKDKPETKKKFNKKLIKKDKVIDKKEKFKLKRKLKRENAKLKKKNSAKSNLVNKSNSIKNSPKDKNELWFEVDQIYLDRAVNPGQPAQTLKEDDLIKKNSTTGLTKVIGIDCEMVGIGPRKQSALARVSIVNQFGHTIYDKFIEPEEKVTDYRTFVSGIRPHDLVNGMHIDIARKEVEDILRGKILVGHAVHNDLIALNIKHPKSLIRDTSIYFKKMFNGKIPSLKRLSETLLNVKVQTGEHSSVEDAKATMRLYTLYKKDWEASIGKTISKKQKV